ncbi:hypothetical protein KD5_01100 [Yersinia pseudotuberculosis]|nr:PAAR/S-type pyocin domain-containing protein [Yersinia pseudotuberculosis]
MYMLKGDTPTGVVTSVGPGFKAPSNAGNNDGPTILTMATVLPMPEADESGECSTTLPIPEEKDFRDYILNHLVQNQSSLYISA